MPVAIPEAAYPTPRLAAPSSNGHMTPKRSARRPIAMPPMPKPTISSVYGSDASARAMPNSACTDGSTTETTYIPLLPIVISNSVTTSRATA